MTVPTTGMKFRGRYKMYRMMALGANLANGFLINFPSRAMLSPPALICRPSDTKLVHSRETNVPSKVSISASSIKKDLDSRLIMVELSLRVSSAALMAAIGPDVNAMIAA